MSGERIDELEEVRRERSQPCMGFLLAHLIAASRVYRGTSS
jgi:hypothetical protein